MNILNNLPYWPDKDIFLLIEMIDLDNIKITSLVIKLLLGIFSMKTKLLDGINKGLYISKSVIILFIQSKKIFERISFELI